LGKVKTIIGHHSSYKEDILEVRDLTIMEGLTKLHLYSFREYEEVQVGLRKKEFFPDGLY
jgi:hypothetical protein